MAYLYSAVHRNQIRARNNYVKSAEKTPEHVHHTDSGDSVCYPVQVIFISSMLPTKCPFTKKTASLFKTVHKVSS